MEVRDPIHGAIQVTNAEKAVVADPFVQRLRHVRATGFSSVAFPGATHSRYAHSLGVLHLAGRAFDSAYTGWTWSSPAARERLRAVVRLAALAHDLGHSPFSHCTEFAMPPLAELRLDWYGPAARQPRKATHEDYTIAILAHTDLAATIERHFPCTARHVAALVSSDVTVPDDFFVDGGLDHRRLLSQIVSSELDVDRLDYLVRDSYYSGARYGQVDVNWLITNLGAHVDEGRVCLALDSSAIYAFDDFLIARHHMFLMVYFHHKSVIYEEMLRRYVRSPDCDWSLSADLGDYLNKDDPSLLVNLRASSSPWARAVVEQRPWVRVLEMHGSPEDVDLRWARGALEAEGIEVIAASSTGRLSRYQFYGQKRRRAPEIFVLERLSGTREDQPLLPGVAARGKTLADATRVFERYEDARSIARMFVAPAHVDRARAMLGVG